VIEVEEDGEEDGEGDGDEHIAYSDIPEMNKPPSINGRKESLACWQRTEAYIPHLPYVHETREEDDCQGRAIIFNEDPDIVLK